MSRSFQLLPELTIVVPSFNERQNVEPLIKLLHKALDDIRWEAIFVDDDSPDGTADEVRRLERDWPNVRVIQRLGRRGLSSACAEGILASAAPIAAVIDADRQHDETKLVDMFKLFKANPDLDLVVGSRHLAGASASAGFSARRSAGSDIAIWLTRKLLKLDVTDPMSGFFMVKRQSFNEIALDIQKDGFKILADMLVTSRNRWNVREVGYEFRKREAGESKMNVAIVAEFLALIGTHMLGGIIPIRFLLFLAVGFTGVLVQLLTVWFTLNVKGDNFVAAQLTGVFVAMTTNFALNNILTYADRVLSGLAFVRGLISFYAVCSIGMIANVAVANYAYQILPYWMIASVLGAGVGAIWNFGASAAVTWRAR